MSDFSSNHSGVPEASAIERLIAKSGQDIVDPEGLRTRVIDAVRTDHAKRDLGRYSRSGFITALAVMLLVAVVVPRIETTRQRVFSRTAAATHAEAMRISQESRLDSSWAMVEVFRRWRGQPTD